MTMIYDPMPADTYEGATCVNGADFQFFTDEFNGTPLAESWRPVHVERYASNNGRDKMPADFPWLGSDTLVMRSRAVDALRDMLEDGGEILPLATDDGVELFVLNVTRVIDALDEERSTLRRLPNSGKIIFITAPAFHEPRVRDVDFFKLPRRASEIFVGQRFVDRVHAAGLVGLDFELAWSSDGGPVKRRLF